MNEPKDYDAEIIPDPTPARRLVEWLKLIIATKKLLMTIFASFFVVTGVAIKGNIEEVNPWIAEPVEEVEQVKPQTHTHDKPLDHDHQSIFKDLFIVWEAKHIEAEH